MSIYCCFSFPILNSSAIYGILTQYVYSDLCSDLLLNEHVTYLVQHCENIVSEFEEKTCNEIINILSTFYSYNHEHAKSLHYIFFGAKNNNPTSLENLGFHYENLNDTKNAIKYYRLAITYGSVYAYSLLAELYKVKLSNNELADFYYKKAFDNEYLPQMYNVAMKYMYIDKNYTDAINIYNRIINICDKNVSGSCQYDEFRVYQDTITDLIFYYRYIIHNTCCAKKYYLLYIEKISKSISFEYAIYLSILKQPFEEIEKYCEIMKNYIKIYWHFSTRKIKKINKFLNSTLKK